MDKDLAVRLTAFDWLKEQTRIHGDVLPRKILEGGYFFDNNRIHLISPQGIFKPEILDLPLSITTSPNSKYDDDFSGKLLNYKYRGTDPEHSDNKGLRRLIIEKRPLIYFFGLSPGHYSAIWPVYVVGDDPKSFTFQVAVDNISSLNEQLLANVAEPPDLEIRREYITSEVKQRLHQRIFRERVLDAYHSRCSFCNLKHRELLDAAHIVPDVETIGIAKITNGLALCKLHHAAFDTLMLGVSNEYVIHVREDILNEADGPILQHGLKGLNHSRLLLPRSKNQWPDRELLDWRFERFKKVS